MPKNMFDRLLKLENRGALKSEYIQVLKDEFKLDDIDAEAVYLEFLGV